MNNTFITQSTDLASAVWIPHCHSYTDTMNTEYKIFVAIIGALYIALSVSNIMISIHCNVKLNIFVSSKYTLPLDLRLLFGFICLFCCISSILWFISILMSYFCLASYETWVAIAINGDNFYRFGLATLFLLYLIRLNHAFKDTELAVSKTVNIFCVIGFVAQLIIPGFTTYFFLQNDWIHGLQCVYTVIVINTFFTLYLLILFARKIFILASKINDKLKPVINSMNIINPSSIGKHIEHIGRAGVSTETYTNNATKMSEIESCKAGVNSSIQTEIPSNTDTKQQKNTVEIQINWENQEEIDVFSPTIKYIICAFVSIASTNFMSVFIIVRSFGYDDEYAWLASMTAAVLDQTVNLYCVYLQFPFANGVYWKCCKRLHLFCMAKSFQKIRSENESEITEASEKKDTEMVSVEEVNTLLTVISN